MCRLLLLRALIAVRDRVFHRQNRTNIIVNACNTEWRINDQI